MLPHDRWKQINNEMNGVTALAGGLYAMQYRAMQAYRASQATKHPGSKPSKVPLRKTNRREWKRRRKAARCRR